MVTLPRVTARDDPDEAYEMGYADGEGDFSSQFRAFLDDLIADESFCNLPRDQRDRAKRLAHGKPDPSA